MPHFVDNNLLENESVLHRGNISWIIFLSHTGAITMTVIAYFICQFLLGWFNLNHFSILLFLGLVLLLLPLLVGPYLYMVCTEVVLTNKRFILKTGYFNIKTAEIFIEKIESVTFSQDLLGRIFNYGTISLTGSGGTPVSVHHLRDPSGFRNTALNEIQSIKNKHRQADLKTGEND